MNAHLPPSIGVAPNFLKNEHDVSRLSYITNQKSALLRDPS